MPTKNKFPPIFSHIFYLLCLPILVTSDCCHRQKQYGWVCRGSPPDSPPQYSTDSICADCTLPTPYCGYGPCNIWGCDCEGGCRDYPRPRGQTAADYDAVMRESVNAVMAQFDTDKDGGINIHEFRTMRDIMDIDVLEEFENLDENQDGFIKPNEIDEKYT